MILAILCAAALPCSTQLELTRPVHVGFERVHDGVFIQAKVNGQQFWFVVDSGASRSVLDESVARRLGFRATESSTLGGGGIGRVPVKIAKHGTLSIDGLTLPEVEFRLLDLKRSNRYGAMILTASSASAFSATRPWRSIMRTRR